MTSLDDELYLLRPKRGKDEVEVYSRSTNKLQRQLTVPGLKGLADMTSCKHNRCLYISDHINKCVHRVELQGKVTNWSVNDSPSGLSVTDQYNLLVTFYGVSKLKEFTTSGQQLRVISLQSGIVHPNHAVELSSGQFVVCHGQGGDQTVHGVCKVDVSGHVTQRYVSDSATTGGQLNVPRHLAVDVNEFIFVVDHNNRRVVLLSSSLSYVRQLESRDLQLVEGAKPWRLCLDVNRRRLYVSVREDWNVETREFTAGRVVVVDL